MKEKDIGEKVHKLDEREYGEGWTWKRTATTIVLAAGILSAAVYGSMRSYTPVMRTEHRVEQREKPVSQQYEKRVDYVAVEK